MVNYPAKKNNEDMEDIKSISEWFFLLGLVFIIIGITILIVVSVEELEFNDFLISNIWSLGLLIMGSISITGGAIVYALRLFKQKNM